MFDSQTSYNSRAYACYLFEVSGNDVINDTVYLISGVIDAVMILVEFSGPCHC